MNNMASISVVKISKWIKPSKREEAIQVFGLVNTFK